MTFALSYDPSFQNFEFTETLGSGGMGVVYKARHRILNRLVAIKTLHVHRTSPEALMRFQLEGKATSSLSHRNIVGVHDFGVTQSGQAYMVIDFIDGETLADVLAKCGQLPLPRFYNIFIQVCEALEHAHSRWILHRDVKPSNIMILTNKDGSDDVRIMDFGIAKVVVDTAASTKNLTKTGEVVGSVPYMSPEQARGDAADARSDLYSLGCVMYECLVGVPPFQGKTDFDTMLMHLEQPPMSVRQASMGREFDVRLERAILRLLEKDPELRYRSMKDVEADLRYLQSGAKGAKLPSEAAAPSTTPAADAVNKVMPLVKGFWLPVTVSIVLLLLIGTVIGYSMRMKKVEANDAAKHVESTIYDVTPLEYFRREIEANRRTINPRTFVDTSEVRITDADLEPFRGARLTTETLLLPDSDVTDKGLQCLLGLALENLRLSSSKVHELTGLEKMHSLQKLSLDHTNLSPKAFDVIVQLKNLKELELSFSNVNDADLKKLEVLPLASLKLENTALSRCAVDEFIEKQPTTVVVYYPPVVSTASTPWLQDAGPKSSAKVLNEEADQLSRKGDRRAAEEAYWNASLACRLEKLSDQQIACEQCAALCAFQQNHYLACVRQLEDSCNRVLGNAKRIDGQWLAVLFYRKANAEEKLPPADKSLRVAITDRENAEKIFVQAPHSVLKPYWAQCRGENLSALAADLRRLGDLESLKKAVTVLQQLVHTPDIPGRIKQNGMKMLESIDNKDLRR